MCLSAFYVGTRTWGKEMSKHLSMTVKGRNHTWCFDILADEKYMQEWLDDGLDIVIIENTIPMWVNDFGLTHAWVFMQDLFNFRNPFK